MKKYYKCWNCDELFFKEDIIEISVSNEYPMYYCEECFKNQGYDKPKKKK